MRDQPHAPSHASDATPDRKPASGNWLQKRPCEPRERKGTIPPVCCVAQPKQASIRASIHTPIPIPSHPIPSHPFKLLPSSEKTCCQRQTAVRNFSPVRWSPRWKDSLACLLVRNKTSLEPFLSSLPSLTPYLTAERRVKYMPACMLQKRKGKKKKTREITNQGDTMPTSDIFHLKSVPERQTVSTSRRHTPIVLLPYPMHCMLNFPSPAFASCCSKARLLNFLFCPTTSVVSRLQIQFGPGGGVTPQPLLWRHEPQGRSNCAGGEGNGSGSVDSPRYQLIYIHIVESIVEVAAGPGIFLFFFTWYNSI